MEKDLSYFPHDTNAKDDADSLILIEELGLEGYGIFWVLVETLRGHKNYKAPLRIIPGLSRRYNTTAEKMKAVVVRYNLFVIEDDTFFYSEALIRKMKPLHDKRKMYKANGIKGNLLRNGRATHEELSGLSHDEIIQFDERRKMNANSHQSLESEQGASRGLIEGEQGAGRGLIEGEQGAGRGLIEGEQRSSSHAAASKVKESKVNQSKVKESVYSNPPTLEDVEKYFQLNGGQKQKAAKFYHHYTSTGWKTNSGHNLQNWETRAQMWIDEDKQANKDSDGATGQNVPSQSTLIQIQEDSPPPFKISQFDFYVPLLKERFGLSIAQVNRIKEIISESNFSAFQDFYDQISNENKSTELDPEQIYNRFINTLSDMG